MGKLFDSIKRRNGTNPVPGASSRLPAIVPMPEEHTDSESDAMPFYEVPAERGGEASTVSIARPSVVRAEKAKPTLIQPPSRPTIAFAPAEPTQRRGVQEIDDRVVVIHLPDSPHAREYRELAEHLARLTTAREVGTLTLLPLEDPSSTTITIANLGCAWAEFTRHPIVLIDAARSRAGHDLATLLGMDPAPGWEELMTGATLAETIQQTGRAWLDVIASGRRLAWANTQAWAKRSGSVLQTLKKHYRQVLLLGPAYPHSPLGLVLAEMTDSTCVIVPADQPNHPQKEPLLKAIAQQGGQVLGSIVLDQS
jgi:hypothetical protein